MTNPTVAQFHVFEVADGEYIAATDLESAVKYYLLEIIGDKEYNQQTLEEYGCEDAYKLSEEQMDIHKYNFENDHVEGSGKGPIPEPVTFRERLRQYVEETPEASYAIESGKNAFFFATYHF